MTAATVAATEKKKHKDLPALNRNFSQEHLTPDERAIVKKVLPYMWAIPRVVMIAVGLEINAYACADQT
jgi:coenzyme PQQ precursor peptide PqqA